LALELEQRSTPIPVAWVRAVRGVRGCISAADGEGLNLALGFAYAYEYAYDVSGESCSLESVLRVQACYGQVWMHAVC